MNDSWRRDFSVTTEDFWCTVMDGIFVLQTGSPWIPEPTLIRPLWCWNFRSSWISPLWWRNRRGKASLSDGWPAPAWWWEIKPWFYCLPVRHISDYYNWNMKQERPKVSWTTNLLGLFSFLCVLLCGRGATTGAGAARQQLRFTLFVCPPAEAWDGKGLWSGPEERVSMRISTLLELVRRHGLVLKI